MIQRVFTLLFFVLIICVSVNAQSPQQTDSTKIAFLPALAFNSDLGFIGGGIASIYKYKDQTHPFYSYTDFSAIFSTKGLASVQVLNDKPFVFGTDMRLKTNVFISRFLQDPYYGVANYQTIEHDPPDGIPNFYQFKSFSIGLNTTLRIPLSINNKNQQLDALAILNLDYQTPWDSESGQLITIEKPRGFEGGRTFMIGSGLIWEGRNSEFNPTNGTYLETSIEIGNKLWGGTFNNLVVKHEMFHYLTFHLLKDITLANRFYAEHTSGETPYWKLAYAGDNETLRGYPSRRFLDENVAILNNELRTWLVEFPSMDTRLGGTIFFDVGRTFANGTSFEDITDDLKYTFGFGATASIFTPDFIIRADVGFSEEGKGVYITTGYMF